MNETLTKYQRRRARIRERYATDPAYSAKCLAATKRYADANPAYTAAKASASKRASERDRSKRSMRRAVNDSRARAKLAGIPHAISILDVAVPETCPVLGVPLEFSTGKKAHNSPSIDRMRPELGYVAGNVRVISHRANVLKNNGSLDEMRRVVQDLERIHAPTLQHTEGIIF